MAETTEVAKVVIKGDTKRAVSELKKMERANERLEKSIQSTRERLAQLNAENGKLSTRAKRAATTLGMAGGIAAAAVIAGQKIGELADASVKLNAVMQNLGNFSIAQARTATRGMVADFDLAKAAIQAQRLGVVKSEEEFAKLANVATKLGLSVGQDATKSVEDLTTALARQSPMILDNLGIQLKVSDAHKIYAARLGKSVSALTEAERAQAFMTVALEKGEEAAAGVTLEMDAQTESLIRAKTQMENLKNNAIPALAIGFGIIAEGANDAANAVLRLADATSFQNAMTDIQIKAQQVKKEQAQRELFLLRGGGEMERVLNESARNTNILAAGIAANKAAQDSLAKATRKRPRGRGGRGARGPDPAALGERDAPLIGLGDAIADQAQENSRQANIDLMNKEIDLMEARGAAEIDLLNKRIAVAEEEGRLHDAAVMRLEQRQIREDQQAAAIEVSKKREQDAYQQAAQIAQVSANITTQTLDLVVKASGLQGEKAVRLQEKVDAAKMFIRAAVEGAEAAAAFARYDFIAFAAHTAAAGLAATTGALIASGAMRDKANSAQGSGGRFGGGGGGGGGGGSFSGGGGGGNSSNAPTIPISPVDESLSRTNGTGRRPSGGSSGGSSGGNQIFVLGATEGQVSKALKRVIDNGGRSTGDQI